MAITALEIKDKTFGTKMFGYNTQEVEEFLDIVVDDYEELVRTNREKDNRIKELEDKLGYFDEMKESLSQSVILAQETAEKVKASANTESTNILNKATYESQQLIDAAKAKANEILRDATDEAKRIAVETEELKRQSRVFHQHLLSVVEGQLTLANSPEWTELLQPTAVYLQNSDAAFKEVVEQVLDEHVPEATEDTEPIDVTRQFTPEELKDLHRRVAESNKKLEETQADNEQPIIIEANHETAPDTPEELNLNETQTFKLNINE
ncbi:DivIVA domain-containing protein [Streptococcus ratti]|uniref:DivIVA domain-containing protein n=1 Tax=Streptococcus ratti TaxID=1341 RepID=A0A7X9LCP1_STRRT|nr:DivIVA domain-containing protein [Streptococcus ratti]NMD48661.1 DivIVA domain-containing protein [Streptococcus ratti]